MNPSSGGPCQGIRNLAPELIKLGIQNEVVCMDSPDSLYLKQESFVIHAIGKSVGPWQYNNRLVDWLRENIEKYDAIVIHGLWLYHGYAVRKVLKELTNQIPYFVMPHGMLDPYFQKSEARKIKALRNNVYWKFIESKIINGSYGVLFTCEEELNLARNTFTPYHPKREINIGYGIPKPFLSIEDENMLVGSNIRPYFLFLSRIHPKKGVDMLIEAYHKLLITNNLKFIPDLVVVGPGIDEDFGNSIFKSVQQNVLIKDKIKFKGMLTGEEKWKIFQGCEVFILPSHQENFGIAVVEALSFGKPVLISDKVNIWREIENSNAGLIQSDTVSGTLQLLQTWIELSESKKKEMSLAAFSCYENHFNVESAAKRTYETMHSLLITNN